LENARWPARLQRLTMGPIIELVRERLGEEPEIWLDGGHNPHAGRAVARAMADMESRHSKPLLMISGMQANKDAVGYFTPFGGLAKKVYCVAADHDGVMKPEDVCKAATKARLNAESFDTVETAFGAACADANEPPRFLISGSLYLAGEILRDNA
jgi:dihydrofolate synthase/folylpolyglutamate synthase